MLSRRLRRGILSVYAETGAGGIATPSTTCSQCIKPSVNTIRLNPMTVRLLHTRPRPVCYRCLWCSPKVLLGMLERNSTEEHRYMLVVSIDNLDRCPHRQIVNVLEAVHLLLEKDKVRASLGRAW